MARNYTRRTRRRSKRTPAASGKIKVKGHTRSPRGPDRGKKPVRVGSHRRKHPRG